VATTSSDGPKLPAGGVSAHQQAAGNNWGVKGLSHHWRRASNHTPAGGPGKGAALAHQIAIPRDSEEIEGLPGRTTSSETLGANYAANSYC